ncbi:MAG: NAD(+) diphosphatase [Treponema sp.]|nr:NAD(+) diphosphatase [Treponema sp.]
MLSNQDDVFSKTQFVFRGDSIILQNGNLPDENIVRRCMEHQIASDWFAETEYNYSALLLEKDAPNPAGCEDIHLRDFFWRMKDSDEHKKLAALSARAKGLLSFRKNKRFCSICGGPLHDDKQFTARTCSKCGHQFFPQIEPAVIVLVSKGNEILLAQHMNRTYNFYSCIAGFVEVGETIEHAVVREIKEETGLDVKDVRYVASQSWPFPDQLMLAFRAEYAGGEIKIQKEEIRDAQFFPRDDLPQTPPPGSVAWNLIHECFE